MTKEQVIQAVLNKATKNNCNWVNEDHIRSKLLELYDSCKGKLGEERFNFYGKHHRLTDLLYKLKDGKLDLNKLDQLDRFSLENDRILPRLLQADENELSSTPEEIAEYDLFEYNPRHHPYTIATKGKNPSDPDFAKCQIQNKVNQELLEFAFDDILTLIGTQRAAEYKELRIANEELQKHLKRQEALKNPKNRPNWTIEMLPSINEEDYLQRRIDELSKKMPLLNDKTIIFSILDRMCYEMRSVQKGFKTIREFYAEIRDLLREHDLSNSFFNNHGPDYKTDIVVNNAYLVEKFPEKFPDGLPDNRRTPTERTLNSNGYKLWLIDTERFDGKEDFFIDTVCVYHVEHTWKARTYSNGTFVECTLETLTSEQQISLKNMSLEKLEKNPQFNREGKKLASTIEDSALIKTILKETSEKKVTDFTEKVENHFCIFTLDTKKLSANRYHTFFNFMRGLAGLVLAPLRALFHAGASLVNSCVTACNPDKVPFQKQAFFRTQSRYCLYRANKKLSDKENEMDRRYPRDNDGNDGLFRSDVSCRLPKKMLDENTEYEKFGQNETNMKLGFEPR